jgi:hypothetical protein
MQFRYNRKGNSRCSIPLIFLVFCYQAECDIRDFGKKVHNIEIEFDETHDKLQKAVGKSQSIVLCQLTSLL